MVTFIENNTYGIRPRMAAIQRSGEGMQAATPINNNEKCQALLQQKEESVFMICQHPYIAKDLHQKVKAVRSAFVFQVLASPLSSSLSLHFVLIFEHFLQHNAYRINLV